VIIVGWILLALLAYKVSQFDYEMANFDPYEILNVSPVSWKLSEVSVQFKQIFVGILSS
jgi:translocation protein SEC63